jgi:hypothetical protein
LKSESDPISVVFKMLDKIDPIVATWRYLHHYRVGLVQIPASLTGK